MTEPAQAGIDRRLVGGVFALAVLALLARWGGGLWHWNFEDLEVYRAAAKVLRHGGSLYSTTNGLPFTYPPFAAVVFVPLQLIGVAGSRLLITAGSVACYLVVVVVCGRRLPLSSQQIALAGAAFVVFDPVLRTLQLGQINLLLTAMAVLDCLVVPTRWRGLLVGVAAGVKLVPGVFVLYFALRRDWPAVTRSAVGLGLSIGVSALVSRHDTGRYWTKLFYSPDHIGGVAYVDNQSLFGVLVRLTHHEHPPQWQSLPLQVAALALACLAAHRRLGDGEPVAAMSCIGVGGLLASPISWSHHWIWLIPAVLVLLTRRQFWAAGVISVIAYLSPQWFTPSGGLREFGDNWLQATACSLLCAAGVLFLAVMLRPAPERARAEATG